MNDVAHGRSVKTYVFAVLILAGLVLITGFAVKAGVGKSLDHDGLAALALRRGSGHDAAITLFQWITWLSDSGQRTIMVVIVAAWLLVKRRARAALVMLVVPSLNGVSNSILKEAYGRARPEIVPHLDSIANLSYPSGHAANAVAFFLLAALLLAGKHPKRWRAAALAIAFLVGVSRLALGVHWPSDVIGGWLWGAAFALIGYGIVIKLEGSR